MDLVDNIHLVAGRGSDKFYGLPQRPDFIYAAVGGAVNLQDVYGAALRNLLAISTLSARFYYRRFCAETVKALGQDAGYRGLPYPAGPRKKIGMGNLLTQDGIL
jgi:hypothetical protein